MLSLPYSAGLGAAGIGSMGTGLGKTGSGPHAFIEDKVPVGEVDIRRGDSVHATDGEIGHVAGLVIDPADHHVTHVLLDEGHLWGAKRVAIPIGVVTKVDVGVRVTLDQGRDQGPAAGRARPARLCPRIRLRPTPRSRRRS